MGIMDYINVSFWSCEIDHLKCAVRYPFRKKIKRVQDFKNIFCKINLSEFILFSPCRSIDPDLLRSNVKRVIGIIVGLLKDWVSVDSSPVSKRARIKKFIKK